jgi:hypothetical protein
MRKPTRATARVFFHRTTRAAADAILAGGFRDVSATYLTDQIYKGVWLSDVPLDCNDFGAIGGDVLLLVSMALSDAERDAYEWVEEGRSYHEWLLPTALVNERATVREVTEDQSFSSDPGTAIKGESR